MKLVYFLLLKLANIILPCPDPHNTSEDEKIKFSPMFIPMYKVWVGKPQTMLKPMVFRFFLDRVSPRHQTHLLTLIDNMYPNFYIMPTQNTTQGRLM